MIRFQRTQLLFVATLGVALLNCAGCEAPKMSDLKPSNLFSLDNAWPWNDDEPRKGVPVRMVGTWTDTVMYQAGKKPQRGFGGRLMFYDREGDKPILVEGQLIVYAFDETNRDPTDNKPTRRYVFPPEQMPLHMSKNEIGPSYSFWLPWDEVGGPKTEVSLMCRFEPTRGTVIVGEQTRHLLPGTTPLVAGQRQPPKLPEGVPVRPARPTLEGLRQTQEAERAVQQASYESSAQHSVSPTTNTTEITGRDTIHRMSVASIALPKDYQPRAIASPTSPPQMPPAGNVPLQHAPTSSNPSTPAKSTLPTAPRPPVAAGPMPLIRPQLLSPQPLGWPQPLPTESTSSSNKQQ
jgi:hypothetical protein